MGWNTTVVVMNDSLGAIEQDPAFGRNFARACAEMHGSRHSIDVPALGHCNAATVIETHHADGTVLVAVGGNYGTRLHSTYGFCHHEREQKERLLRELADAFGYRIVRKSAKETA